MGLDFTNSSGCVVDGGYFHDVSSAAVQIGSSQNATAAALDANNTVADTVVVRAAAEYSGAAGIQVGYTQGTVLEHNDVSNLTCKRRAAARTLRWSIPNALMRRRGIARAEPTRPRPHS